MNDPEVDAARRDRAAVAAAPYMHQRVVSDQPGKKVAAEEAAKTIHIGSSWERLLAGRYDTPAKPVQNDWETPYKWPSPVDDE
jgi:hypothetical protein